MKNRDKFGIVYVEEISGTKKFHIIPKELDTKLRKEIAGATVTTFDAYTDEGQKDLEVFLSKDA